MKLVTLIMVLAFGALTACAAPKRVQIMNSQSAADSSNSSVAAARVVPDARGDLQPVDDLLCDPLNLLAQKLLLGERPGTFWMLCTPDFKPAFAMSIVETYVEQPEARDLGGEQVSYFIRIATAHERIREGVNPLNIAVQRMAIDKDSAEAILGAGRAVVCRTRYERPIYSGNVHTESEEIGRGVSDGARFEFQMGHRHGQALSPEQGFAADLTRLCYELFKCVDMPPATRANALAKCVETALMLKDEAERAPW